MNFGNNNINDLSGKNYVKPLIIITLSKFSINCLMLIKVHHYELNFGPLRAMTLNDIIEKNDLRQFHSDIILCPVVTS